jgi:uncharacterized peroxidase-related enzyme
MPQPRRLSRLPVPPVSSLPADLRKYLRVCGERLGLVPNVLRAYALKPARLRHFINTYNDLMLGDRSRLTVLEREMIAVVVSSANRCYYCLVAHGQAVRQLSGDPELGELLAINWRMAPLPARQQRMLAFAHQLTTSPEDIVEADRMALRRAGFSARDIFDIIEVAAFFNYTNRMAAGLAMLPNPEYHALNRTPGTRQGAGSIAAGLVSAPTRAAGGKRRTAKGTRAVAAGPGPARPTAAGSGRKRTAR